MTYLHIPWLMLIGIKTNDVWHRKSYWGFIQVVIQIYLEKKEEIWLSPVTKTPTPTEQSKKQRDNIKTPPKTLNTKLLRTDLGRSIGVIAVTQLVWLNKRNTPIIKLNHIFIFTLKDSMSIYIKYEYEIMFESTTKKLRSLNHDAVNRQL